MKVEEYHIISTDFCWDQTRSQ